MKKNLLLSILILSFSAFSQNKNLTLSDAIEIALIKNTQIIIAKNNLATSKSGLLYAYGGLMPKVSASTGKNETNNNFLISGKTLSINNTVSLNSSITLFDGFANFADINKSNSNIASAEFALKRTMQSVVFETKRRYLQVLKGASLLDVSKKNLERSKRQLQRITETNKVGAASKADVYRQQVATANDELSLIRAENNYENAKADLNYYIALPVNEIYNYVSPEFNFEDAKNKKTKPLQDLIAKAMEVRPDYLALLSAELSAESDLTISKAGHYPTISANASYGLSDKKFNTINNNKSMSWGLNLSVPLFTGFGTSYAISASENKLLNSKEQSEQIRREILVDVQKALLDFESTKKELEVTVKNVISAREDLQIAEERYKLGSNTLLDLLVATTNFVKAESDKINAEYNFVFVLEQINFAVGENIN